MKLDERYPSSCLRAMQGAESERLPAEISFRYFAASTGYSYVVKSVKPDNFTGALLGNSATSVREPPMASTERFNVDR